MSSTNPTTTTTQKPISILFVCLGNICRSPLAEAVFRHHHGAHPALATVDSAGTAGYHTGAAPDPRTLATLRARGINGYAHAARAVADADFERFDYLLGMDEANVADLRRARARVVRRRAKEGKGDGEEGVGKVMLFGEFGGGEGEVVVDPYYGGQKGFEVAYEQMVRFGDGLVKALEAGEL